MNKKQDFNSICRTCLGVQNLFPIFNNKKLSFKYSTFIFLATGIKVSSDDGLPQNICKTCISFINKSMKFRLSCKENANKLLNIMTRKTTREKNSTKIGLAFDNSDAANENCLDSTLSEDTDFSEENIKIKSQDAGKHIPYNENNQFEIMSSANILKNTHNEDPYNDNETDNENNLDGLDGIITENVNPYNNTDSNNEYNHSKAYNEKEYNHKEAHNNKAYNHNDLSSKSDSKTANNGKKYNHKEACNKEAYINTELSSKNNPRTLNNRKEYNHNEAYNEKTYNHNELVYKTDSNTANNGKEFNHNEESYNHNKLSYKTDLKTKYMISTKNNRVICKICSKNLAQRSFDMHIWKCHPGVDERKILCTLCHEYVARSRMKTHMNKHGDKLSCVYCNNFHENKKLLIDHTSSCGQKIKKRKPCKTSRELKECDICHKMMQKGSLRLHKEVKHAGLGPICEHCNKKFSNKFRLMEHLRAKHGYDKFKCKLCDFETASEVSLKNHERRHSGIKPYLCEKCGAKFHAAYLLAQHRNSHTTDKIYKCDQCPASFKTNNSLHMHRMTCHSTKSLNCSICARSYTCRLYLVKHMRGVHRFTGPIST